MTWQRGGGPDDPGAAGDPDTAGDPGMADDPTRTDLGDLAGMRPPPPASSPPVSAPPPPPASGAPWAAAPPPPPPTGMPAQGTPPWMPPGGAGRYGVPGAPGLEYAGALPRFVGYLIDAFLLFLVSIVISAATSSSSPGSTAVRLLGGLLGVVISAGYFTLLWTSSGRATLGMRLLRLQLGNAVDGRMIAPGQALRRWLAYGSWLPSLVAIPSLVGLAGLVYGAWSLVLLFTIATDPTHQGLHDRFAETAMVQPAGGVVSGAALGCLAIVVVAGLFVLGSIVALIFLGGQVSTILSEVGTSI
jgi:uncharacterized RDD family membrane protein YckC